MGVIQNVSNITNPFSSPLEDALEEIIEDALLQQEHIYRRPRRTKQRAAVKPETTAGLSTRKTKSAKKNRRYENSNYLMTLAEGDDIGELTVYDFIPETASGFAQLLMEKEKMEVWNDFINRSDEEQWRFLMEGNNDLYEPQLDNDAKMDTAEDCRNSHPAFSADECFQKIDSDLRSLLRKRHVPLGTLAYLEEELSAFFQTKPRAIYRFHLSNSFDRLMLHGLCQYMDLSSISYNQNGARWTKVHNRHHKFRPPSILLSAYLEQRPCRRRYS